eukprot:1792150-Alexandrium_andersonii.AAC.1
MGNDLRRAQHDLVGEDAHALDVPASLDVLIRGRHQGRGRERVEAEVHSHAPPILRPFGH